MQFTLNMWLTASYQQKKSGMMNSNVILTNHSSAVVISYEHTSSHLSSLGMEMCPVRPGASDTPLATVFLFAAHAIDAQCTKMPQKVPFLLKDR